MLLSFHLKNLHVPVSRDMMPVELEKKYESCFCKGKLLPEIYRVYLETKEYSFVTTSRCVNISFCKYSNEVIPATSTSTSWYLVHVHCPNLWLWSLSPIVIPNHDAIPQKYRSWLTKMYLPNCSKSAHAMKWENLHRVPAGGHLLSDLHGAVCRQVNNDIRRSIITHPA